MLHFSKTKIIIIIITIIQTIEKERKKTTW